MPEIARECGDIAFDISTLLLKTARSWKKNFTDQYTDEKSWLLFVSLVNAVDFQPVAVRTLKNTFKSKFGTDPRSVIEHIKQCQEFGWLAFDEDQAHVTATELLRDAYDKHRFCVVNHAIQTAQELRGHSFTPSPYYDWPDELYARNELLWNKFSEHWKTALETMLGDAKTKNGKRLSPAVQSKLVDRFFTATYWFLLVFSWRHKHFCQSGTRNHLLKRDRLRAKMHLTTNSAMAATDYKLRKLVEYGVLLERWAGKRAAYEMPDFTYNHLTETFTAFARDLHGFGEGLASANVTLIGPRGRT